jgi:hypothetical protein
MQCPVPLEFMKLWFLGLLELYDLKALVAASSYRPASKLQRLGMSSIIMESWQNFQYQRQIYYIGPKFIWLEKVIYVLLK